MSLAIGLSYCRTRALHCSSSALLPWRLSGIPKLCRFRTRASGKRKLLKKKQRKNEEQSEPSISSDIGDEIQASEIAFPSKGAVIQACTLTSGFIAGFGILLRQVSHVAAEEGLPILDCSEQVSFGFETWHLGLILGLVLLISSSRYLLLKTWPDFAQSSEAANRQVLSSLEPLDYLLVAFLPGVSEELLFRGALQPLFGMDWKSVLAVAALFGVLHLGNGRKYSFAVWATFVGCIYGYSAITSSSIIVPMASHALNNLVGGLLWYNSQSSKLSNMLEKFGGRRRKEREWLKQERKRKKKKEKRNKNKNKNNDKGSKDGSSLPRFGEWDESDPSSAEGYSAVFDLVRKEKKSDVGNMSFKLIDSINTRRRRNRIRNFLKSLKRWWICL